MNEEIKKIINTLNGIASGDWIQMLPKEANKLLDYITNLQLEQTKKVFDTIATLINEKETCTYRTLIYDLLGFEPGCYADLISGLTITNMLVDYENLREENKIFKENNQNMQIELCKVWKENEDYKSRAEKAVELIKNKLSFETYQHLKKLYDDIDSIEEIWEDYEFEDLLNILQNGSEKDG